VVGAIEGLLAQSESLARRNRPKFLFVTILDQRWWTSDIAFSFRQKTATSLIRKFLVGTNFLGWWEFGYVRNHRGAPPFQGKLVTPHFHAIVWGRNSRALRKQLNQRAQRFSSGFAGIRGVKLKSLPTPKDVLTVACYGLKSPIMAYRVIRRKDQTFQLRKTRNSFKGHLQLFRILQGFEHVDTMAAGGRGTDVARGIRRLCAK
jgi:hypothetical protein